MAFQRFTEEELYGWQKRYVGDDLFRTWARTLSAVEWQLGELSAVEVWSETEEIRRKLMAVPRDYQDTIVQFQFAQLRKRHQTWQEAGSDTPVSRKPEEAVRTALLILTVLFTQLADGAPDEADDAADRNPNAPLCRALEGLLRERDHWPFVHKLLRHLFDKEEDNRGKKIVLPVTDYLGEENPTALMGEEAVQEVEQMVKEIVELTRGIRPYLRLPWERYEQLWRTLCADPQFLALLQRRDPKSAQNVWRKNWKLVANVIGILKTATLIKESDQRLCAALKINLRAYISCHADYRSSNSVLSKEQHKWVEEKVRRL